ncbi:hypothetical protein E4U54_000183 [Claviceps lovelessii]|nr:hypothetical protein E4U54_000183 [Claviceps lovelessii]
MIGLFLIVISEIDELIEAEGDGDYEDDDDHNGKYSDAPFLQPADDKTTALRAALRECWTLCNTLASLSATHHERSSHGTGTPNTHAKAWKTCWKLCQRLYQNQDEDPESVSIMTIMDMFFDLYQALYDIRAKDECSDYVFRVNCGMNYHLYSLFGLCGGELAKNHQERTIDFLIALCHRLIKQRNELTGEVDHLLDACWNLTGTLFNLQQDRRDGKPLDDQLLGSAVQACWDLGNIFKDGCTQIRPERSTSRLNRAIFSPQPQQPVDQSGRESRQSSRSSLGPSMRESVKSSHEEERPRKPHPVPETPVTEFEDTPISPESRSPPLPDIMVLGTSSDSGRGGRWSSNASNMSSYSRGSNRTSSTAKTTTTTEDVNIVRFKVLMLRAAMHVGFERDAKADAKMESALLQEFVQGLKTGCFGSLPSHATLLQHYKDSVLTDPLLLRNHVLPKRVMAYDMAKSVMAMSGSSARYAFLQDLFKFVCKFTVDEAESHRDFSILV